MLQCAIHDIPMEWVDEVILWICKYGCIVDPRDEIARIAPGIRDLPYY